MSLPDRSSASAGTAALLLLLAGGCAVGPDFKKPAAPVVNDYKRKPLTTTASTTAVSGGEAQRISRGPDCVRDGGTFFQSQSLNELIEHSLTNNPELKAAQAALSVAK